MSIGRGRPVKHDEIILAEFGSLQLELVRLTQLTGDDRYQTAGNHILEKMSEVPSRIPGLYPMTWNHQSFTPKNSKHIKVCRHNLSADRILSLYHHLGRR